MMIVRRAATTVEYAEKSIVKVPHVEDVNVYVWKAVGQVSVFNRFNAEYNPDPCQRVMCCCNTPPKVRWSWFPTEQDDTVGLSVDVVVAVVVVTPPVVVVVDVVVDVFVFVCVGDTEGAGPAGCVAFGFNTRSVPVTVDAATVVAGIWLGVTGTVTVVSAAGKLDPQPCRVWCAGIEFGSVEGNPCT
jgi:hypothetical protein